jgi:hypothetical protein
MWCLRRIVASASSRSRKARIASAGIPSVSRNLATETESVFVFRLRRISLRFARNQAKYLPDGT